MMQPSGCYQLIICFFNSFFPPSAHIRLLFSDVFQLHLCSLPDAASLWFVSSIPSFFHLLMWGFCFRTCSSSTYAASRMLPAHDMFLQFHPPSICSCEDFVLVRVSAPPMQPPGCCQLRISIPSSSICSYEDFILGCVPAPPMQPPEWFVSSIPSSSQLFNWGFWYPTQLLHAAFLFAGSS